MDERSCAATAERAAAIGLIDASGLVSSSEYKHALIKSIHSFVPPDAKGDIAWSVFLALLLPLPRRPILKDANDPTALHHLCSPVQWQSVRKMLLMPHCYVYLPIANQSIAVALLNSKTERKLK